MIKRTSLSFKIKQDDYENFKLISDQLIKARMFRSQLEIVECFISFLWNANREDLIKLKLAPTIKETPK